MALIIILVVVGGTVAIYTVPQLRNLIGLGPGGEEAPTAPSLEQGPTPGAPSYNIEIITRIEKYMVTLELLEAGGFLIASNMRYEGDPVAGGSPTAKIMYAIDPLAKSQEELQSWPLANMPRASLINYDDNYLYFTVEQSRDILTYDILERTLYKSTPPAFGVIDNGVVYWIEWDLDLPTYIIYGYSLLDDRYVLNVSVDLGSYGSYWVMSVSLVGVYQDADAKVFVVGVGLEDINKDLWHSGIEVVKVYPDGSFDKNSFFAPRQPLRRITGIYYYDIFLGYNNGRLYHIYGLSGFEGYVSPRNITMDIISLDGRLMCRVMFEDRMILQVPIELDERAWLDYIVKFVGDKVAIVYQLGKGHLVYTLLGSDCSIVSRVEYQYINPPNRLSGKIMDLYWYGDSLYLLIRIKEAAEPIPIFKFYIVRLGPDGYEELVELRSALTSNKDVFGEADSFNFRIYQFTIYGNDIYVSVMVETRGSIYTYIIKIGGQL